MLSSPMAAACAFISSFFTKSRFFSRHTACCVHLVCLIISALAVSTARCTQKGVVMVSLYQGPGWLVVYVNGKKVEGVVNCIDFENDKVLVAEDGESAWVAGVVTVFDTRVDKA